MLRFVVASACAWEATAIVTRRLPTFSSGMWRLPRLVRAVVWIVVGVALTDHFFTRRVL